MADTLTENYDREPLLSIIIPFYSVEQYISKCLESVFNQDIPENEYEVICVNDASPDSSREFVIEYQKKHKNLVLIEHETNRKLGVARNTGRSIARGKYIWNVDSDDYIKPGAVKKIIEVCEEYEPDILAFNFDHLKNNTQSLNRSYPFVDSPLLNGIDFLNIYCLGNFSEISPVWSQVYKRKFLDEQNIYSPPINMGEDVPFTLLSYLLATRVMSITNSFYVYRINDSSLGGRIETQATSEKLYEKCFKCSSYINDTIKYIPKQEKQIRSEFKGIIKYILLLYLLYSSKMAKDEKLKFKRTCRNHFIANYALYDKFGFKNFINYIRFIYLP